MYCIKCGVKLGDSEKRCPLCDTVVFNPEIEMPETEKGYPVGKYPISSLRPKAWLFFASVFSLLALAIVFACDFEINNQITWSGIVGGAFAVLYSAFVLPFWFSKPNPTIFVPVGFAIAGAYLWYLNDMFGGNWFLNFAFPITVALCLIITAMAALLHYLDKGRLFIFGGGFISFGLLILFIEFLLYITFEFKIIWWSLFPLSILCLLGLMLIFLGICRPAREAIERKFFY